jgi:hypothetical protein
MPPFVPFFQTRSELEFPAATCGLAIGCPKKTQPLSSIIPPGLTRW